MYKFFYLFIFIIVTLSCNNNDFKRDWYLGQTKITITQDRLIFKNNESDFLIYEQVANAPNVYELKVDSPDERWIVKILSISNDSLIVFDSLFNKRRSLYKKLPTPSESLSN